MFEYDERHPDKYADLLSAAWAVLYGLYAAKDSVDLSEGLDMWARQWPEDAYRTVSPETRVVMNALRRLAMETGWEPPSSC